MIHKTVISLHFPGFVRETHLTQLQACHLVTLAGPTHQCAAPFSPTGNSAATLRKPETLHSGVFGPLPAISAIG